MAAEDMRMAIGTARETQPISQLTQWQLSALAFLSVFSFFPNPLFPENEIFPYYILPALTLLAGRNLRLLLILALSGLGLGGVSLLIATSRDLMVTDTLQLVAIAGALFSASSLSSAERSYFARCLKIVVTGVVAIMILQRIFPPLVDFVFLHLVRREATAAELQAYTGGVPGIAPEPAYMGSYIIGAWVATRRFSGTVSAPFTLTCAIGIVLTASLSAALMFAVMLALQLATSLRRTGYLSLLVTISVALTLLLDSSLISRVSTFVDVASSEASEGLGVLSAVDASFGSLRLATLVVPLSELGCGSYFCGPRFFAKGYSVFAVLYALVAPLHWLFLLVVVGRARDRLALSSVLLSVFYGPVLNWSMYVGFLSARRPACTTRNQPGIEEHSAPPFLA